MAKLTNLTIRGKEYPCRVTMGAMVRYKAQTGKDISTMQDGVLAAMVLFIWCFVAAAFNADDVAFDMDYQKFADSIEPDQIDGFMETGDEQKKTANEVK